jgi:hypothetical protein
MCLLNGYLDEMGSRKMASSSVPRIVIATKQSIEGAQRKLAWFSLHKNDLYFEMAGMLGGSHCSYHRDGRLFRTSPATERHANLIATHLPLPQFEGWHRLGLGMVLKSSLAINPALKDKDKKSQIHQIDIDLFPSDALNLMAELLDSAGRSLLSNPEMYPPPDAQVIEVSIPPLWVFITVLGHSHNLLISPYDGEFRGVVCRHLNKRYSANPPGRSCYLEAYRLD